MFTFSMLLSGGFGVARLSARAVWMRQEIDERGW